MTKRTESKPKTPKVPGLLRLFLSENVKRRLPQRFPTERDRPRALAEASGVRLATIQRVINKETGANLETLEGLAKGLKAPVFELLAPPEEMRHAFNTNSTPSGGSGSPFGSMAQGGTTKKGNTS